jgi:hypothetical protein
MFVVGERKPVRALAVIFATALMLSASNAFGTPGEAPDDYAKRLLLAPQEFVLSVKLPSTAIFVDVGRVQSLSDGTLATHVYAVVKDGQPFQGKLSRYEDLLVQYDCRTGSILLRQGIFLDDNFTIMGLLTVPSEIKPWIAAQQPKIAATYGYIDLCKLADPPRPRMGNGQPWTKVAASILADMRAQ